MYRKILYVVAALFFLLTISIQSCRKNGNNVEITQAKTQLSLKMEKLKMQFEQLNYQQYLSQSLSDSVRQFLYPSWKQAYQIKQGDSAVFTYVKLWPRLFLNDSSFNYLYKSVARQYILVEEKNGRTVFYKVSAVDFGGPNATTFKGNLEVENLQTHKTNVLHFNSDKYRRSGNTANPQARNPDDPECFYYFTCTYSGICNNIVTIVGAYGGPSVYSVVTCDYPLVPECPNVTWTVTHSSTTVDCDDPPPAIPEPATPDPSGVINGGYIPSNPIPGPNFNLDPFKGHMCGILNFKKVGSAYVGTISKVGILYQHPSWGVYNFEFGSICVTIPSSYITDAHGASNAFIANWNWTADEVLAELQAMTGPPSASSLRDRFVWLLGQNLKGTNSGSSINWAGTCLGDIPTTQAEYDCL